MKDSIKPLLEAIKDGDAGKAAAWSQSESWATIEQVLQAAGPDGAQANFEADRHGIEGQQAGWACVQCTFLNPGTRNTCEVCGAAHQA